MKVETKIAKHEITVAWATNSLYGVLAVGINWWVDNADRALQQLEKEIQINTRLHKFDRNQLKYVNEVQKLRKELKDIQRYLLMDTKNEIRKKFIEADEQDKEKKKIARAKRKN